MKKLVVGSVELDVSHLSNSDIYNLVRFAGECAPEVYAIDLDGPERLGAGVAVFGTQKHWKCYKNLKAAERYTKSSAYEAKTVKATHKISASKNDAPAEPVFYVDGVGFRNEYARQLLSKKPQFNLEFNGRFAWFNSAEDRDYFENLLRGESL